MINLSEFLAKSTGFESIGIYKANKNGQFDSKEELLIANIGRTFNGETGLEDKQKLFNMLSHSCDIKYIKNCGDRLCLFVDYMPCDTLINYKSSNKNDWPDNRSC